MSGEFHGQRVTVMGLGGFGGGAGVVRWLVNQGASVLLTDQRSESALSRGIKTIGDLLERDALRFRLGGHVERDFVNTDLVIANPAVPRPWENRFLNASQQARVPVTTEIGLLVNRLDRSRVIGVTGTAGKSTTSSMIHHLLSAAGRRVHLGGNIGGSLLGHLDAIGRNDWVVLELSSFMLYWLGTTGSGWSPHIAVWTNLSPNHLDWHGDFNHYRQSKENIFRHQQAGDHAVRGDDLPAMETTLRLAVPGQHNQRNALLALAAAECAIGTSADELVPCLLSFAGLPHRLQRVAGPPGCRVFNDSKSTTPQASVLAVESFDDPGKIHLIAGGYDKGADLTPIAHIADRIAGLYTIGATGPTIATAARIRSDQSHVSECTTLRNAIEQVVNRLCEGDVILLSPGCASWDQFASYEERGEQFTRLMAHHANKLLPAAVNPR